MKKPLLFVCVLLSNILVFAATIPVTPDNYESAYNSASDGDILSLDAGTYSTPLDFPVGKSITLQKAPDATSMPVLTFAWVTTVAPTEGSSLILDGLEIDLNDNYFIIFTESSLVDNFTFKNSIIANVGRCLIRATDPGIVMNNLSIDNCIIKDCGINGYCLVWFREILNNYTITNNTMYNYGGEGFYLAQNNDQTHTFTFDMHNNTIYQSGKDGLADYGWCSILINYAPTSTYNISNNIFNSPYTTADSRVTMVVPDGSGAVTCKNNLVVNYPNFTGAPAAGWDIADTYESTENYFKDATNHDFTLPDNFPYKGTDNNFLGASRWWPGASTAIKVLENSVAKTWVNNGFIHLESDEMIGQLELYSINGTKILSRNLKSTEGSISTKHLNKGIYLLSVQFKDGITIKKLAL